MATGYSVQQLTTALKAADAAGDTQAARMFATKIRKLQTQQPAAPVQAEGVMESAKGTATQSLAGINEGLATIGGAIPDLAQGAINYGIDGINAVSEFAGYPTDIGQLEGSYGTSKNLTELMTKGNMIAEADPRHATARRIGKATGEGLGMVATGGALGMTRAAGSTLGKILAAPANQIVQAPIKGTAAVLAGETAAATGSVLGGDYGKKIGGTTGEVIGTLAGAMVPSVAGGAVVDGVRGAFNHSRSGEIYDALEAANIRPSAGLVGNKGAGVIENLPGNVPIVGAPTTRVQQAQNTQFGNAIEDAAEVRRGSLATGDVIDPANIGGKIRNIAEEGVAAEKQYITAREQNLERSVGPDTNIDVSGTRQTIRDMQPGTDATRRDALNAETSNIERNAAPAITPKHQLLQNDKAGLEGQLASVKPGTAQHARITAQIEKIDTQLAQNRQIPYENILWRTNGGSITPIRILPTAETCPTWKNSPNWTAAKSTIKP